jgi:tape measure domain-containing protein
MSSVDDRIVNMKFNNSQFGQGVDKTKRDLTGLEKTIASTGKSKGMTQLGAAADGVRVKFSALQVAGAAALGTIVSKATLAGINLVKSLTIAPIMDGFKEYTTNLESVQTIMANTGASVQTVNKYLDQLNAYSDQTIYNFSEMARNIGTFTAAGVELDTATSAIKGISNLAALSGSNSQQASRAMYQLSQAIAAGKVGLMDWNSVVNAGMGGKVFKNALAQTAVAMGDLSAGAVKVGTDVEIMGQSFRNSISAAAGQESWLSSKVLVTTLSNLDGRFSRTRMAVEGVTKAKEQDMLIDKERIKLAKQGIVYSDKEFDAMVANADRAYAAATQIKTATQLMQVIKESIGSMWANAFEYILGDFEQSKELWGNVGDVIVGQGGIIPKISEGFLGMLNEWQKRGGRDSVISGFANMFGSLLDVLGSVASAFRDIFPENNINLLNRLSKAFEAFSKNLIPSKETLEDIRTIAGAFFAVLHLGFTSREWPRDCPRSSERCSTAPRAPEAASCPW